MNLGIEHGKPDKRMFCKIKPDLSTCRSCIDMDMMFGAVSDCGECQTRNREYEIMEIVQGIFDTYAIVYNPVEKILKKVSMSRLCDVRY